MRYRLTFRRALTDTTRAIFRHIFTFQGQVARSFSYSRRSRMNTANTGIETN